MALIKSEGVAICLIAVIMFLLTLTNAKHVIVKEIESEKHNKTRVIVRTAASDGRTSYLFEGQSVTTSFCVETSTSVSMKWIRYSNDGDVDNVDVKLDEMLIGSFTSIEHSDWGRMWNVFHTAKIIGSTHKIKPGIHQVSLEVRTADDYGIELDCFSIEVDSGSVVHWCDKDENGCAKCSASFDLTSTKNPPPPKLRASSPLATMRRNVALPPLATMHRHVFDSECIGSHDIGVSFQSKSAKQFRIVVKKRENAVLSEPVSDLSTTEPLCHNRTIWQIGKADGENKDLKNNNFNFPMALDIKATPFIRVHYTIPKELQTSFNSPAYLTIRILPTTVVNIGVQFHDHRTGRLSEPDVQTLSQAHTTQTWMIPPTGLFPPTHDIIVITFTKSISVVMFDYLKLGLGGKPLPDPDVFYNLYQDELVIIQSGVRQDKSLQQILSVNISHDNSIDAKEVRCFRLLSKMDKNDKSVNIVTIHADGKMHFNMHVDMDKTLKGEAPPLSELSGILIGGLANIQRLRIPVQEIRIHPKLMHVNITYVDGTKVCFQLTMSHDTIYIDFINNTTSHVPSVTYFEPEHLATVDTLTVNHGRQFDLMSHVTGITGSTFQFRTRQLRAMPYSSDIGIKFL